ncbi:MAG: DUF4366 domain-containing protein [Clostridia bacterium]|nr:DUF4366 domain-containing protein [Clostridia bacterium]
MRKTKLRTFSCLLMAVLCMTVFSVTAFASDGGYYASDESGNNTPPDAIDSITISTEDVELKDNGSNATTEIDGEVIDLDSFFNNLFDIFGGTDALTPVGNLTLIDDILQNENTESVESVENEQKSKQFITVQSKNGNYFYIIIDRSGDTENVYFLNLVDEADLLALMEDGETEKAPATCSCADKCAAGAVNTACEICAVNMTECVGKETKPVEPDEPKEPTDEPTEEPEKKNNSGIIIVILILAVGGGAAFYFFKVKNGGKGKTTGNTNLDDYDYGADDDEYEFETYEEPEDEPLDGDTEDDEV